MEEIALAYIRLRRLHRAEMNRMEPHDVESESIHYQRGRETEIIHLEGSSPYDVMRDKRAHLVLRYEASIERHIQRCLNQLKDMKAHFAWIATTKRAAEAREEMAKEPLKESQPAPDSPPVPDREPVQRAAPLRQPMGFVSHNNPKPPGEIGFVSQKTYSPNRPRHPRQGAPRR